MEFVDLAAQRRRLGERIDRAIARVVDHGKFIMGPEVYELEERLAEFCGARHAISCSSGTDALLLALLAWGVGPGDAVFVPTFTFAATAEVVALVGAVPVFVDVDDESLNIDTTSLGEALGAVLTAGALRPAGVIAVDLFGRPADYDALRAVVAGRGMWVLADAAQSFGATSSGRPVGSLADATATSFFPAKPLGCYGDGGAVITDDDGIATVLRSLRVHGQGSNKYENVRVGINARLDTVQAAVLLAKLEIFGDELRARRTAAGRYGALLEGAVRTPPVDPRVEPAWAQYTVRSSVRDALARHLAECGIPSAVYYPTPLHRQSAYRRFESPVRLDDADRASLEVLSVPMHPYLSDADVEAVASAVHAAVGASVQGTHIRTAE